jgi:hypothetical protein
MAVSVPAAMAPHGAIVLKTGVDVMTLAVCGLGRCGYRMWCLGIAAGFAAWKAVRMSGRRTYNSRRFCLIDITTTI